MGLSMLIFSITMRNDTRKNLKILLFLQLLLLFTFRLGLLFAVFILSSLSRCSTGGLLLAGSSECILLRCAASLVSCLVLGLLCGTVAYQGALISCKPLSYGTVLAAFGGMVFCVCGVGQNDSIVGWSVGSGGYLLQVLVFALGLLFSLFFPRALSTAQIPSPPASLISLLELFYRASNFSLIGLREYCCRCCCCFRIMSRVVV